MGYKARWPKILGSKIGQETALRNIGPSASGDASGFASGEEAWEESPGAGLARVMPGEEVWGWAWREGGLREKAWAWAWGKGLGGGFAWPAGKLRGSGQRREDLHPLHRPRKRARSFNFERDRGYEGVDGGRAAAHKIAQY